jgi:hypothetical protein
MAMSFDLLYSKAFSFDCTLVPFYLGGLNAPGVFEQGRMNLNIENACL